MKSEYKIYNYKGKEIHCDIPSHDTDEWRYWKHMRNMRLEFGVK